jgi:hypothetical protein
MKLDLDKLPTKPRIEKAVWEREWQVYGTLYTAARSKPRCDMEEIHPEVVDMIMRGVETLRLPDGWKHDKHWFSTEWSEGAFVSFFFVVPHRVKFKAKPPIPPQVGYLLSAHLQLGEAFNFRNFSNHRHYQSLKFLPFLITPKEFRFHIHHPIRERVESGIETFREVLSKVQGITPLLPEILADIYSAVRLDEVCTSSQLVQPALDEVRWRLHDRLRPYHKQFGFVYKDLQGSQDARLFCYEMNAGN